MFSADESGMDAPYGDVPNISKFPKVFSPFRAISLFLGLRMSRCPAPGGNTCCFFLASGKPPWATSSPSPAGPRAILFLYPLLFRILLGFLARFPFQTGSLLKSQCLLMGTDLQAQGSGSRTERLPALASLGALFRPAAGAASAPKVQKPCSPHHTTSRAPPTEITLQTAPPGVVPCGRSSCSCPYFRSPVQ